MSLLPGPSDKELTFSVHDLLEKWNSDASNQHLNISEVQMIQLIEHRVVLVPTTTGVNHTYRLTVRI